MILLVIINDVAHGRSGLPRCLSTPLARVIDDDTRYVGCLKKVGDLSLVPHLPSFHPLRLLAAAEH